MTIRMTSIVFALIVVLCAVLHIWWTSRDRSIAGTYATKALGTTVILVFALWPTAAVSPVYRTLVAAGLVLSLAGDIFLVRADRRLLAGMLAFFLAHIAYIAAFLSESGAPVRFAVLPVGALYGIALMWFLWNDMDAYRLPASAYTAVLVVMIWAASEQFLSLPEPRTLAAFAGGILFLVSDSVLAVEQFRAPFRYSPAIVMSTYYAAQWLIAFSVHIG